MTDTSKFRADVLKLFEPRPPLQHMDHVDTEPPRRKTAYIAGIGSLLTNLHAYKEEKFETTQNGETIQMKDQRLKQEKQATKKQKMDDDYAKWNPNEDPHIKGDPYKTVFVGRLDYNVSEIDLQKEFTKFGTIERVRIVRDKDSGKSKGYAFVVFEKEAGARSAYKEGNGMKLGERSVLTDIERGRTGKTWLPRRLGGGVGGRGYSQKRPLPDTSSSMKKSFEGPPVSSMRSRGTGSRFPSRGGRNDSSRSSRYEPGDQGSRESRDRYSSSSSATPSRASYNSHGYGSTSVYKSRTERPERSERPERPERPERKESEKSERFDYSSRSRREDRDYRDRERDQDRSMPAKERERLRY